MPRNFARIAGAAVLGLAMGHGAVVANAWPETPRADVAGSRDNAAIGHIGAPPAGQGNPPAVIVGSGENVSVRHIPLPRG